MKHALAILALGAMAGCSQTEPAEVQGLGGLREWTDSSTGCVYYVTIGAYKGGISPKLRSDGTPECPNAPRLNPDGTQVCIQKDTTHESD